MRGGTGKMSLCFNGYPLKLSSVWKKVGTKTSCIALYTASTFLAGFMTAGHALAENIGLAPRNDHIQQDNSNNINWFKAPEKPEKNCNYVTYPQYFNEVFYDSSGINGPHVSLKTDSTWNGSAEESHLPADRFNIEGSSFDILAGQKTRFEIQNFNQADGTVSVPPYENDTAGITTGTVNISGGKMHVTASGIDRNGLETSGFRMADGYLTLQGVNSAKAIHITGNGKFNLTGGTLQLKGDTGSSRGWAVYGDSGSRAFFGKESVIQPILDMTSSGYVTTGLMSFDHVEIEKGAAVEFQLGRTLAITSSEHIDIPFLASRASIIDGEFTTPQTAYLMQGKTCGARLFYSCSLIKTEDGYKYNIRIMPQTIDGNKNNNDFVKDNGNNTVEKDILKPSALLTKASYTVVRAIEAGLSDNSLAEESTGYDLLSRAYDKLYNSETIGELEQHVRGLHAYQATRFPSLITTSHDRFSYSFQRELTRAAARSRLDEDTQKTSERNSWAGWIKPLGGNENYNAHNASYRDLDVNYSGFTIGTAGRYRNVTTGMAFGFMQGRLNAPEGYDADTLNLLITTGLTTGSFNISRNFKPFLDLGLGYGWSRFDQNRHDTLGGINNSVVKANSLRLTLGTGQEYFIQRGEGLRFIPKATLDYTYIKQDQYYEHGGYLPLLVSVGRFRSLRPKIGSELLWAINPQLALNAYSYYRYELLDSRASLDTRFAAMPEIRFITTEEDVSRDSFNIGFEMTYQALENTSVSGSYDLLTSKNYAAHQFYIQSNTQF